jgi:hypothetical protein
VLHLPGEVRLRPPLGHGHVPPARGRVLKKAVASRGRRRRGACRVG